MRRRTPTEVLFVVIALVAALGASFATYKVALATAGGDHAGGRD